MRVAASLLTAAVVLHGGWVHANPPATVVLAPIGGETINRCNPDKLTSALKRGLRRGKHFRLGASEQDAVWLELLECSHFDQVAKTVGYGQEGNPESGGLIMASEQTVELGRESIRTAVLRARLVSGPRFIEVASGPDDRHLEAAVSSLRSAIDAALEDRGRWLIEGKHINQ
jgi:hypothetical protein